MPRRARHRRPDRVRRAHHRRPRPGAGPLPAAPRATRARRPPRTAVEMVDLLRQTPSLRRERQPDAAPRPAQGLARARHPAAVRGRRPRGARAAPTSTTAAAIDDPRVDEVRILRPQEIPRYVADGLFDVGITGRDWIEETRRRGRHPHRAALLEGDRAPDPHGARGRGRLAGAVGARPPGRRSSCTPSTRSSRGATSSSTASTPTVAAVVRRDRGQGPRHRRRGRRDHRDRSCAARRRAARSSTPSSSRTPS